MRRKELPNWSDIHTIVFDFDGVFTNNKVWVNQDGVEAVRCDRGDGLGLDLLRNFMYKNDWALKCFILSKETNPVVTTRAKKIKIDCVQSCANKANYLSSYLTENNLEPKGLVYLGNDLNDLPGMIVAGFSVAPSDSHEVILEHADLIMPQKGGEGFVRAFIELLIGIEKMTREDILQLLRFRMEGQAS